MIRGTEGHMADGTRPKATPKTIMAIIATIHEFNGNANVMCTKVSKQLPMSIRVAPLPYLS